MNKNKKKTNITNIHNSIFFKLSILIILSIIVMNFIVFLFITIILHFHNPEAINEKHLETADLIIKKIGIPPNKEKMEKISKEFRVRIIYIGPEYTWINFHLPEDIDKFKKNMDNFEGNYLVYKKHFIVKKQIGEHFFYIGFGFFKKSKIGKFFIITLIFVISIVLILLSLIIRKILSPIKYLVTGVNKIKNGDFSYRIPINQKDELGKLAVSFNNMVIMLKELIKSKDQLLLDVSHELRSPLTRIKFSIEFIKNEKAKKNIKDDILEMEELITEILESEKLRTNNHKARFTMINIINIIEEIQKNFKNKKPGILIENKEKKVLIMADELRIKMLIKNLITNALRYSKPDSNPVKIILQNNENNITIKIIDNGIGIDKKDIPYLFEPFYRTDFSRSKEKGGYGLGLFLCKKIIDIHNGTISIESELNKGTTVTVTLKKEII